MAAKIKKKKTRTISKQHKIVCKENHAWEMLKIIKIHTHILIYDHTFSTHTISNYPYLWMHVNDFFLNFFELATLTFAISQRISGARAPAANCMLVYMYVSVCICFLTWRKKLYFIYFYYLF